MDPNEAWKTAVSNAFEWREIVDSENGSLDFEHEHAAAVVDAVLSLAEWMEKGGFPPVEFQRTAVSDLVVDMSPLAVREHFEGDDTYDLESFTDDELRAGAELLLVEGRRGFWESLDPWWHDLMDLAEAAKADG